jgi:ATP phosphoribosyltransferase
MALAAPIDPGPPLVLAVPSKGRLQEAATAFFARAGLEVAQGRGSRDYCGSIVGVPGVEVAFLSASEIVSQLAAGAAHFGVTGEDLVREKVHDADARLELLAPLGFGRANVVVAAPQAWIDVRSMSDLEDVASAYRARRGERMRVATKYVNLTRRFFADHGVADYRIVESLGATEGAPGAGAAELIVDITTTGATLAANALKTLDDGLILRSQAMLVASIVAPWGASARATARSILSRIAASEEARTSREIRAKLPSAGETMNEARERFGAISAMGDEVDSSGSIVLHCAREKVGELADWLLQRGATRVSVDTIEQVFDARNLLYESLERRIGPAQEIHAIRFPDS